MKDVKVNPCPVIAGERVEVQYNGSLAENGSKQLYLHAEMVTSKDMKEIRDIRMKETEEGWKVEIRIPSEYEKFKFSFKDSANNMDDNEGRTWTYNIVH